MQFFSRVIALIAVLLVSGCHDEKEDALKNFSPEGRIIMENDNLSDEQKARFELVDLDYIKAPPEMRAIAHKIFLGQTLTQPELKALGSNIDKSFPDRKPNGLYRYGRTLLITAVESHNLAAVDALLQAGADPYISIDPSHESARIRAQNFILIALDQEGEQIPNTDYFDKTYANQLLELYLKHGGNPNYKTASGKRSLLDIASFDNFAGFKMLVKAGADPWAPSGDETPLTINFIKYSTYGTPKYIKYLAEQGFYDRIPNSYIKDIEYSIKLIINAGINTDVAERGKYYSQIEDYAEAIRLVLKKSNYSLKKDSEIYRLLYVDDGLYRQKKSEKHNDN